MQVPETPKAIDREALNTALAGLDISIDGLMGITADCRHVTLTYFVKDSQGDAIIPVGGSSALKTDVNIPIRYGPTE